MEVLVHYHVKILYHRGTAVIFGGSSNADGSTELFADGEADGETAWSTVSYHEKLANRYRFGTVSIDDEVYAFGRKMELRIGFNFRWLNFQAGRFEDEQIQFMVSISSDTESRPSRIPEYCQR